MSGKFKFWTRILLLVCGISLLLLAIERLNVESHLLPLAEWIDRLGFWGPVAMILSVAMTGMLVLPGLILTMTALCGVLYGPLWGTVFAFLGCALASVSGFALARFFGRERAAEWLQAYPYLAALDEALAEDGIRIMMLLRVAIIFPFAVQSYGLGLTRASARDFLISLVAMLPGNIFYVVAGALIGDISAVIRAENLGPQGKWRIVAYAVAVVVILLLARQLGHYARKALAKRAGIGEENG